MFKNAIATIGALTVMTSSAFATPSIVFEDRTIKMGYLQSGDVVSRAGYSQCTTSIGDRLYVRSGNTTNIHPFFSVEADAANISIRKNSFVSNERGAFICHNDAPTPHKVTTGYVESGTNIGAGLQCVLTIGNFNKVRAGCSGCGGSVSCSYNSATGVISANQTERGMITHCGYVCVDPQASTSGSKRSQIVSRRFTETSASDTLAPSASVAIGTNSFFSECSNTIVTGANYSPATGAVSRGYKHHCGHMSFSYIASVATQCSDTVDNDGDGLVDANDPGCSSPDDTNEGDGTSQCQDDRDNDADGLVDAADPGCSTPKDNDESDGTSQCRDGVDNDGDGAVDYPADFSCQSAQDNDESNSKSQCQDGQDNDSDGLVDMNDPGCSGGQDNNESDETARLAVAVECVMDNTDGSKTAYFSYNNATQQVLTVPVSASGTLINTFGPDLPDQGQPTVFIPGVNKGVVGVPLTGSTVAWTVRASGSAQSSALASAASPKCAAVQPLIDCQGYDNGQLRAKGGYLNSNPFDVRLNYGRLNFFTPGSTNRGQPTVFKSGLNRASFGVVLTDPSTQLLWDLNGQKVTASHALPVCDGECINTAVGEIRGELDDLAIQISQLTIDAANVLASVGDDDESKSAKSSSKRRKAQTASNAADAQRAKAKAESYVQQSNTLTIQFPDVIKNCPDSPEYCETVDRGSTIDQLRALFSQARNQAQRTIARAYFKQTGSTTRKDKLVRKAKQLEAQGLAELDKLPRTETVCR